MFFIKDVVLACRDGSKGHSFIQEISIVIYYVLLIIVSEEPTTETKTNAELLSTGLKFSWRHNLFLLEKYIITKDPDIIGDI